MICLIPLSIGEVCLDCLMRCGVLWVQFYSIPMSENSITASGTALADHIRHRRTIAPKNFNEEVPDHDFVVKAIDIARNAPNHHRTEPCRFYILDTVRIREIGQLFGELVCGAEPTDESRARGNKKKIEWGSAPGMLVVTQFTDRSSVLVQHKPEVVREDYATCCCIVQNLLLLLEEANISTKWSTGPVWKHPRFREVVGIPHAPPNEEVVALVFYGKSEFPKEVRELSSLSGSLVNHLEG
jgi:nitroreductase